MAHKAIKAHIRRSAKNQRDNQMLVDPKSVEHFDKSYVKPEKKSNDARGSFDIKEMRAKLKRLQKPFRGL